MRVLIAHRYFWPDQTPCAGIMRWIAKHLSAEGHSVDVLTSQPSRGSVWSRQAFRPRLEKVDSVSVNRLSLPSEIKRPIWRVLNALYLGFFIVLQALIKKYDVIIVTTIPPVLGGVFGAIAAKLTGARLIYYCMDLHPEIGKISGDFSNPLLFRLLQQLDDWTCRQAQPVLVHSEDMRNTLLLRRYGFKYKIDLMNNFSLPTEEDPTNVPDYYFADSSKRLTIVYAGNLGRFQGLRTLLEAMGSIAYRKDIELIIIGDGIEKDGLIVQQKASKANVRFLNYQPVNIVKAIIRSADIGVVMLIPDMYRCAYPSKTMTYLEQGRPIIAAVEVESELAQKVLTGGYGFCVPVGDPLALSELIVRIADDPSWRKTMSQSALLEFERCFSAAVVLAKWSNLVRS